MLRASLVPALVAFALLAGCLTEGPGGPWGGDDGASQETSTNGVPLSGPPAEDDTLQACESESGCDFWDDRYHEFTVYEVDTAQLDVLIVPGAAANALEETGAMSRAVHAWADGVNALGVDWFRTGFKINIYVLGQDTPPATALQDPEIIVLGAEVNPAVLFGIGLEKQILCAFEGQGAERVYEAHEHHGMRVLAADCTGVGFTCFAINTNRLGAGLISMQDLVAHEVGHCLGGGHVGDALDFRAKLVPRQDIMSYQHDKDQAHCVSNLNVRVLEDVYAGLLGRPEADKIRAGQYYDFEPSAYRHVLCENP